MKEAWDAQGRLYYVDDNGNRVQSTQTYNPFEKLQRKAQANLENVKSFINNADTNSQSYKDKINLALGLITAPMGGSSLLAAKGASALTPLVGKNIGKAISSSAIGGATGSGVAGFGRGLVEGENPLLTMVSDGTLGLLFGGAFGIAGGKIGKKLAEKSVFDSEANLRKYGNDYLAGANLGGDNSLDRQVFSKIRNLNLINTMGETTKNTFEDIKSMPINREKQYLFAGENALNADNVALNKAKELFEQGIDNEEIRQLTGWFKGVDDKWKYEIPDGSFNENVNWSNLNDEQSYVPLKNLYNNEALYSAYPEIADLPIVRSPMDWHIKGGAYRYKDSPTINGIMLNKSLFNNTPYGVWKDKIDDIYKTVEGAKWRKNDEDWWNNKISNEEYEKVYDAFFETPEGKLFEKLRDNEPKFTSEFVDEINKEGKKSLLHELQHLIQEKEGFALGGSAEHPRYGHLAGEVEARLAEKRYDLSEIDKKNINPLTQFDVAPEKQVIEFNNNGLYQKLIDDEEFDYNKAKNLVNDLKNGERNPLKKQTKSVKIEDIEDISSYDKEYLRHELNNNLTEKERKRKIIQRPVGDYIFQIKNNGFDDYEYKGRKAIDDILNN